MWEKALGNHLYLSTLIISFSLYAPSWRKTFELRGIELRDKLSLAMDEGFHATCQAISCYRKASFCLFYSGNSSQNSNKKSGYNSVSQIWPCYAILRIVCWRLVITNWCMMLTCLRRTRYTKGQDGLCFFPSWQMISSKGRPFFFCGKSISGGQLYKDLSPSPSHWQPK